MSGRPGRCIQRQSQPDPAPCSDRRQRREEPRHPPDRRRMSDPPAAGSSRSSLSCPPRWSAIAGISCWPCLQRDNRPTQPLLYSHADRSGTSTPPEHNGLTLSCPDAMSKCLMGLHTVYICSPLVLHMGLLALRPVDSFHLQEPPGQ